MPRLIHSSIGRKPRHVQPLCHVDASSSLVNNEGQIRNRAGGTTNVPRKAAAHRSRLAMLIAAGVFLLFILLLARGAVIPFLFGTALAYLLSPLVDRIARLIPGRMDLARGYAILALYGVTASVILLLSVLFLPTVANQLTGLVDDAPTIFEDMQGQFERWHDWYVREIPDTLRAELDALSADARAAAESYAQDIVASSLNAAYSTAAAILGYIVIPVWLFYVLRDRDKGVRGFLSLMPDEIRVDARNILAIASRTVGNYLRAQIFLGLVIGVVTTTGLYFLDVPFFLGLGIIAGITELIPIIGPILGAIPAIAVALAVDPQKALWVALFYVGVQQMENHLLVPRVQSGAIRMNPAVIIMLLVITNAVIGIWGLFFILPLAGVVKEIFLYIYHRLEDVEREQETELVLEPVEEAESSPI